MKHGAGRAQKAVRRGPLGIPGKSFRGVSSAPVVDGDGSRRAFLLYGRQSFTLRLPVGELPGAEGRGSEIGFVDSLRSNFDSSFFKRAEMAPRRMMIG